MKKAMKEKALFLMFMAVLVTAVFGPTNIICSYADGLPANALAPTNINEQGYDVIFCVDNSGSVWDQQTVRDQAVRNIANLAVGSDIRIGGIYFTNKVAKSMGLISMETQEGSRVVLDFFNMTERDSENRDTNIGAALEAAQTLFEDQDATRKKIIILFSDGVNENRTHDSSYKARANQRTSEQVAKLEEKGVDIFCVHLQKQKSDQEYLRQLVNYFKAENTYANSRLKIVTEDKINTLSDEFVKVFYNMHNNMKYREINVDSTGLYNFYVPSLGVKKVQVYLNNSAGNVYNVTGPDGLGGEQSAWNDGSNAYVTTNYPAVGDWKLTLTGDNPQATTGTVAYYAYMYAVAGMTGRTDSDGNRYKNDSQMIRIRFYDENGAEIEVDTTATVTATVTFIKRDGTKVPMELAFKRADNGAFESDRFKFDDYGSYTITARIVYDEFVDLTYNVENGMVVEHAPSVYNKSETYLATKTKAGYQFTFNESQLFIDPDGDAVSITGVDQLNEDNPVELVHQDGKIIVTAAKSGDVNIQLKIKDYTNLETVVTVEGRVINKTIVELIKILIVVLVIVLIVRVLYNAIKKKSMLSSFDSKQKELEAVYEKAIRGYDNFQQEMQSYIEDDFNKALGDMVEVSEELQPDIKDMLGISEYLTDDYAKTQMSVITDAISRVKAKKKEIDNSHNDAKDQVASKRVGALKKQLDKIDKCIDQCNDASELFGQEKMKCSAENDRISQEVDKIYELFWDVKGIMEEEIKCDLCVYFAGRPGGKECKVGRRYIKGCYSLDDVEMLTMNGPDERLRQVLKDVSTDIFVYGHEEDGQEGLTFRSRNKFMVKNNAMGGKGKTTKEAVLKKGEEYRISNSIVTLVVQIK